jgi:uncharacterized protein YjbI with pentapeptide repeats
MSPPVVAAIIAGCFGVVTVIATLAVQLYGTRKTSGDTKQTLKEQLAEQRAQLDRTLAEQRVQLDRTLAEQRTRTLNERFATAAEQLGSDKPPAVRLAGVYAIAGLADDWEENRQTCVEVLCGYLRMPYEPDPSQDAPTQEQLAFRASREVRHTVIRVITAHLREGAAVSWQGLNFDFTGVVFDGGDFSRARFSRGAVRFIGAEFSGVVDFGRAEFSGGEVDFGGAEFSGGMASFRDAEFSGGEVDFSGAEFSGVIDFYCAQFSGGTAYFIDAEFSGGRVGFSAEFSGTKVYFGGARFSGGDVHFVDAEFSGGEVDFVGASFSGGAVDFGRARFSGGQVDFSGAEFSGGEVDFGNATDWSFPPAFPWTDAPPPGVKLSKKEDQSQVQGSAD